MIENETNNFITILTFYYAHEVAIVRSRLEAEGIECNIVDELTVQVNPLYSNAIGGVKLQVRENDAKQAIEILKESGYLTEENLKKPNFKVISFFDKYTSKIPFLKEMRFEIRVMIIVTVLVGIISILTVLLNADNSF